MTSFATTAPIAAVLAVPAGRVQLIAADRADTTVEVRPLTAGKGRDVKAAEQTTVEYRDGVLTIQTPGGSQIFGGGSVEVTVQLPTGSRVEVQSSAAELRAVGRLGDLAFDGANGEIKIDEAASLKLTAHQGDVVVGRLTGPAEISVAKGDITVAVAAGLSAALDAGTTYGRVHNSLRNDGTTDLTIRATTAYGDITARSL